MTKEECLSMKCSRNSTCFIIVLSISRHRSASMSIPQQKSHSKMLSGNDKSGLACINAENLAHAAPIDSFSYYSKSRTTLGRESIRDIGKNARQNLSLSSSQSPFIDSMMCVYHCSAFLVREGKQFLP